MAEKEEKSLADIVHPEQPDDKIKLDGTMISLLSAGALIGEALLSKDVYEKERVVISAKEDPFLYRKQLDLEKDEISGVELFLETYHSKPVLTIFHNGERIATTSAKSVDTLVSRVTPNRLRFEIEHHHNPGLSKVDSIGGVSVHLTGYTLAMIHGMGMKYEAGHLVKNDLRIPLADFSQSGYTKTLLVEVRGVRMQNKLICCVKVETPKGAVSSHLYYIGSNGYRVPLEDDDLYSLQRECK